MRRQLVLRVSALVLSLLPWVAQEWADRAARRRMLQDRPVFVRFVDGDVGGCRFENCRFISEEPPVWQR